MGLCTFFLRSMSSNEDPAATRDQEVLETEEVEVGEGSNGDPAATRDQEVKETEEVDVGEGSNGTFEPLRDVPELQGNTRCSRQSARLYAHGNS